MEGLRVRLEPMRIDHLDALCRAGLDPRLWEYTTISVSTPEEMREYVERALQDRAFVVVWKQTGEVIGSTRFHHTSAEHRRTEIGFTWIIPAFQRQGINREVKEVMLREAFEGMGCLRVEFKADAANLPSRRALEACGAKEEAVFRNYMVSARKGPRDLAIYSILADEWRSFLPSLKYP